MDSRERNLAVGEFLRQRRNQFDPARLRTPTHGRRRVPGMRREELAAVANVSVSYYTRIERGVVTASASVLDAIADALGLDDVERAQLHRLGCTARESEALSSPTREVRVRPELDLLLQQMPNVAAVVLALDMDVLGWNELGHAVFGASMPFDAPQSGDDALNWARLLFLDDDFRSLFADWELVAVDTVGRLRVAHAQTCGALGLDEIVTELRDTSAEFERIWQTHPACERNLGEIELRHRVLGELVLHDSVLRMADEDTQHLRVYLAEPGSTTDRALLRAVDRRRAA